MERSTNPETDMQTQCEAAARRPISANSEFAWVESKNTQKGEPSVSLQNNTANNGSDSGNFSEAVSTPCPPTANSSPDSDLPFFSVGSPCLKLDRTSSTNVLSSSSSAVNQVSPRSLLQDKWSDLPFSSSPLSERVDRPELAMPRIKYTEDDFNGHQYSPEKHLRLLAENFQAFYQQKLREVEFEAGCGDRLEYAERREDVLKGWINDLVEQNRVLIETVDEMEQEAASRIYEMDKKVRHSTFAALQHMRIIQDYEERVQSFLAEKCEYEDTISAQRSKLAQIEFNGSKLEEKLQNLEAENEMLITLITRIRDWGVWDISDLRFGQRTYYRIFELYPHLAGSEVQTVFTIDRARKTEETEKQLENLRTKLRELQDFKCSAETELSEKNRLLSDFQTEREELRLALQKYASENDKYRKSLEETQRILVSRPAQPHKDKEMTDILQELQDLRNQLSLACAEKQNAIAESSSIKKEMHGRMVEFQQMQDLIATIQNDAKNTRSKVQDVQDRQDELKALREQVNVYRMKYDEARDMLNNKSDTIQNLQKQMDHLYEKIPSENGLPPVKDARETNFNENAAECDVQTYYTNHNGLLNNNTKLSPRLTNGQAFHVSAFENSHVQELQDRISLLESQCASKDTLLSSLHCELEAEKLDKQNWTRTMGSKDAEITMQKVTINHLQDALVAVKRGNAPATSVPCGKVFHI